MELYGKDEVGFEHPAKGKDHCKDCKHFEGNKTCEIVEGRVMPVDWCEKYVAGKSKSKYEALL